MNQLLYFIGLKYTSSTIACALTNILPAMTFVMAVPFRIETANIKSLSGQAKIAGTVLCVSGSMLMTFYKGALIRIPSSGLRWLYAEKIVERGVEASALAASKQVLGAMLVVGSCMGWAAWFILQAKMSQSFSAPYTTSALMSAMASIQCLIIGGVAERDLNRWALGLDIRLVSVLYVGVVCSGFAVSLMTWAIEKKGPLYVSMYNPLLLIIVAILGWAILDEKLYLGSVLGSVIIIAGLYLVLWGKAKENKDDASTQETLNDIEESEGIQNKRGERYDVKS